MDAPTGASCRGGIGSVAMDDDPGLFDLPAVGPPPPPARKPTGRARETWVRVVSADVTIVDSGTLTWGLTVRLVDVSALRRIAVEVHPDQAASIADSLAVAWTPAADPFAALRPIPGISWEPGLVDIRHLPRPPR